MPHFDLFGLYGRAPPRIDRRIGECGIVGNPDLYGLGIRLGLYFQWISILISRLYARKTHGLRSLLDTTWLFSIAAAVAVLVLSVTRQETYAIEIIILLCVFFAGSYCSVLASLHNEKPPLIVSIPLDLCLIGMQCYAVWFWVFGRKTHFLQMPCGNHIMLVVNVPPEHFDKAAMVLTFLSIANLVGFALQIYVDLSLSTRINQWLRKEQESEAPEVDDAFELETISSRRSRWNSMNTQSSSTRQSFASHPPKNLRRNRDIELTRSLCRPLYEMITSRLERIRMGFGCSEKSYKEEETEGVPRSNAKETSEESPRVSKAEDCCLLFICFLPFILLISFLLTMGVMITTGTRRFDKNAFHDRDAIFFPERDEPKSKISLLLAPRLFLIITGCILYIELTLAWNPISGIYSLSSVGQFIPFVIGGVGLIKALIDAYKNTMSCTARWTEQDDIESRPSSSSGFQLPDGKWS